LAGSVAGLDAGCFDGWVEGFGDDGGVTCAGFEGEAPPVLDDDFDDDFDVLRSSLSFRFLFFFFWRAGASRTAGSGGSGSDARAGAVARRRREKSIRRA